MLAIEGKVELEHIDARFTENAQRALICRLDDGDLDRSEVKPTFSGDPRRLSPVANLTRSRRKICTE